MGLLTIVKLAAQLVVGTALHHLGHMFCLLVDRHGADDGALRRCGQYFDLDGTGLGDLAVQLLQLCGVLWGGVGWGTRL